MRIFISNCCGEKVIKSSRQSKSDLYHFSFFVICFFLSLCLCLPCIDLQAQNNAPTLEKNSKNFATKVNQPKAKKLEKEEKEERIEDIIKSVADRERWEFDMLKDPATGRIPKEAGKQAIAAAIASAKYENLPASQRVAGTLTIESKGPSNLGGKTRALGIDVRNANIMIGGSTSSGVYRTSNGGTTWTRVVPAGAIHNITCVAQDTRAGFQDTWYFGTGEASGNSASLGSSYLGFGIFKSTDNGVTWSQLSSTASGSLQVFDGAFDFVHRILVNPTNGDVYAASSNTIQKSINGGSSWTTVLGSLANSAYTEIICTPTGRLYAAIAGTDFSNEGVYTSTSGNSGAWTKIAGTISTVRTPATWAAAGGYGRVVLNYAPSDPNIIYALYDNKKVSSCTGVATPEADFFKYTQSTNTWENRSAFMPDETGCSNGNDPFAIQGGYDLAIAVKPNDPNTVFIGGTNIYRSTNGFASTTLTTRIGGYASSAGYGLYANSHSDIHTFVFASGNNNTMYVGGDGGIQKGDITVSSVVWTPLNNDYVTYMYYHVDLSPSAGQDIFIGGAQDNGTTVNTNGTQGTDVLSGDGTGCAFLNYTSPTSFSAFASSQNGTIARLTGPYSGFSVTPAGNTSMFVTYCNLDQDNTNYMYYASSNNIIRTRNAAGITSTTVNSNPAVNWELMNSLGVSGNIRSMATSRNNAFSNNPYSATDANRKLYIGSETGKVYRLNNPAFTTATSAATDITPSGAPVAIVSSISVNPVDDKEVMITYSNYSVNSVYHTTDATAATVIWTNVEGPNNTPVQISSARSSAIVKVAGVTQYFVGTTVGLYTTTALSGATTSWSQVGSSEINYAIISQLRYRPSDNKLLAGTHGNGAYLLTLPDPIVLAIKLQTFTVVKEGEHAKLNWSVGHSSSAHSFEILRSRDGITFNGISNLDAKTNTSSYEIKDYNLVAGFTYYKLKITDKDGTISYSEIAKVSMGGPLAFSIESLSPNPVTTLSIASIEAFKSSAAIITVVGINGSTILKQSINLTKGRNAYKLNFSNIPAGTYYLYLFVGSEKSNVVKFIKD